ncbi:MAG TPA: bifunctional 4-hydroxy-2-oxoglutarate aldolase/2-dehydro-3-deoxy-phosphogluconate aldolase [Streptosporangiaceae bacterium]|nr:bifunctional 4-hydroxy-2-oxoglutarate aldolase/2-dehydro-3-deoxy-phosphogluconate aldolase [Streptosporangiaceae bacterium]
MPEDTVREVLEAISASRLLPVVVIDNIKAAIPLATALKNGGLRCVEITLRTGAAEVALRTMAEDHDLMVGAGTVLDCHQVDLALNAGARYIITPGFNPEVVRHCQASSVPVFPGVATATDIQAAMNAGLDAVKFFPAEPLGGIAMLEALAAPFSMMKFIPTGGISAANVAGYLHHPAVFAVGGSWMVARHLLEAGDFAAITELTAEAMRLADGGRDIDQEGWPYGIT